MNRFHTLQRLALFIVILASTQAFSETISSNFLVVGFVGGFVRHNDAVHQEVQLANRLRNDFPSGVDIDVFANHSGRQAYRTILRSLDQDHNGTLSEAERRDARIILYGHSWGASETIAIARMLQHDGIPVRLTIQVDSVAKPGFNDRLIPPNVDRAVNFYQLNGLLHGQRKIVAMDPERTHILGNIRLDYRLHSVNCDGYPWYARLFMRPHIEIESDPRVWDRIDSMIRAELSQVIR